MTDPQLLMLDRAKREGSADAHDRHSRRIANVLEAAGFGEVKWPGPRFHINDAGRAALSQYRVAWQQALKRAGLKALSEWSAPVGVAVEVTRDDGSKLRTVTRSAPWRLGSETPVILVEGITGAYLLTRVLVLGEGAA